MNKVRETRIQKDMTGNALALLAGIEPGHLSLIERGKRPTQKTANKIAGALGTDGKTLWDDYDTLRAQ